MYSNVSQLGKEISRIQYGSKTRLVAIPNSDAPAFCNAFTWFMVDIPPVAIIGISKCERSLTISRVLANLEDDKTGIYP